MRLASVHFEVQDRASGRYVRCIEKWDSGAVVSYDVFPRDAAPDAVQIFLISVLGLVPDGRRGEPV